YYHEYGYSDLEIDVIKAMEFYKKSIHKENHPDAMYRYTIYLIEINQKRENRNILYYGKLVNEVDKIVGGLFIECAAKKGHKEAKLLIEK
ncbi:10101_t:CDS:2, partial [Scutellospora calospora]